MATTYRVVLNGVSSGQEVDRVAAQLANISKIPVKTALTLLTTPGAVVKRAVDLEAATLIVAGFQAIGCNCVLEPEETNQPAPSIGSAPSQPQSQLGSTLASRQVSVTPPAKKVAVPRETANSVSTAQKLEEVGKVVDSLMHKAGETVSSISTAQKLKEVGKIVDSLMYEAGSIWSKASLWQRASVILVPLVLGYSMWGLILSSKDSGRSTNAAARVPTSPTPQSAPVPAQQTASTSSSAVVEKTAQAPKFGPKYIEGKWLCKFRGTSGSEDEMTMSFGARGEYEGIVFPGKRIESHRIGNYGLNGNRITIKITRIPELARVGQTTSVAIGEGIEVTSFSDREMRIYQWEDENPSDRLAMGCSRTSAPAGGFVAASRSPGAQGDISRPSQGPEVSQRAAPVTIPQPPSPGYVFDAINDFHGVQGSIKGTVAYDSKTVVVTISSVNLINASQSVVSIDRIDVSVGEFSQDTQTANGGWEWWQYGRSTAIRVSRTISPKGEISFTPNSTLQVKTASINNKTFLYFRILDDTSRGYYPFASNRFLKPLDYTTYDTLTTKHNGKLSRTNEFRQQAEKRQTATRTQSSSSDPRCMTLKNVYDSAHEVQRPAIEYRMRQYGCRF